MIKRKLYNKYIEASLTRNKSNLVKHFPKFFNALSYELWEDLFNKDNGGHYKYIEVSSLI